MENKSEKIKKYKSMGFDNFQLSTIKNGINKGLDVSIYAKPEYNWEQMYEIYKGLINGLDVTSYADPKIPYMKMAEIRINMLKELGIELSWEDKEILEKRIAFQKMCVKK